MVGCGSPFFHISERHDQIQMDLRNQPEGKDRESGRRRWKVAIMCDYIKITNFMCKIAQTHEQFL